MVLEYKKLSQSFEEVKAEKESDVTSAELVGSSNMQAALSKLETENAELRGGTEEMLYENQQLSGIVSSWTMSSASLNKLHGATKISVDRTGLGYNSNEGSTSETSSTPRLEMTKFKTMNLQPTEAQSGEDMIVPKPPILKSRHCGLGYSPPKKARESWLNKSITQRVQASISLVQIEWPIFYFSCPI
ncbi:scarecrow-like protein 30 [Dorcoceras hygrometricum]|nr:scarecrow-like protein 30 [Dorcoceras hygrometricum]